ncbi:MAG: alpha/beta hydrolase [Chitinophagaceae bacterium]|nr:alpha/beta hydrolase [Chitinophagaceae bacterium]
MKEFFFTIGDAELRICRWGSGTCPLLCFHGYDEEAGAFAFLEKYLPEHFSVYAVDLPFHGRTQWCDSLLFTHDDLQKIAGFVFSFPEHQNEKISLLGFSLGGRMLLSLYQQIPEKVKKIVLLAPDGLKVNFWYWLASQTSGGNRLFRYTMQKPYWFLSVLKLLNRGGLVNESIYKFVNYYIDKEEVRRLLYRRWTSLRKIKPRIPDIKSKIKEHQTPVRILYGRYDRIILPAAGQRFRRGIESFVSLQIIESGHQVLHEKHAEKITECILS